MGSGTMARTIATGRGKIFARLAVEGWPYVFCTDHRMEKTFSNGQIQAVGLNLDGVRLSCQAEIDQAAVRADGFQAQIADVGKKATTAFGKRAQQVTELTAELSTSGTTATVQSTAGFSSSGRIHINTECIEYSGKTTTTFTGLTRGAWGTVAQKHYTGSGERLAPPRVTDLPEALGGRRVWLYLYDDGDGVIKDPSTFTAPAAGDASIRWRGIATTDVNYMAGLWSFTVDPLTAILGQSVGSDVEEGVKPRGLYFPWNAPLFLRFDLFDGANTSSATRVATGHVAVPTASGGFFSNKSDLVVELNSQLATITASSDWTAQGFGTSAGDAQMRVVETLDGIGVTYYTNSATARAVLVQSNWRRTGLSRHWWAGLSVRDAGEAVLNQTLSSNETYQSSSYPISYPFGFVGTEARYGWSEAGGDSGLSRPFFVLPDVADAAPASLLHLAGDLAIDADMALVFEAEGSDDGPTAAIVAVDTAANTINVRAVGQQALTDQTVLKFGRRFGAAVGTTIAGMRQDLVDNAPTVVNRGGSPMVTDAEMPASAWDPVIEDAVASLGVGSSRKYIAFEGTKLSEIMQPDLTLIGCYLTINSTGQIVPKRLRFEPATAYGVNLLTARNMGGEFPNSARSGVGSLSEVVIRTGYNPKSDEWDGVTIRVRDVQNAALNRMASGKKLEIKPRSSRADYVGIRAEFDPRDAERMVRPLLGMFAAPYESWTVQADNTRLDISVGDTVLVTSSFIPDIDGTLGITRRPALVIGWEWEPMTGLARFDLIATSSPIAGYAPAFLVLTQSNVTGNQWAITCSIASYATGDGVDWLPTGARVRVQKASATEDSIAGVVDSWSTVTCTVTLDSAWTPGSDRWYLSSGTAADSITSDQELFCYMGSGERVIPFSTPQPSRELAP